MLNDNEREPPDGSGGAWAAAIGVCDDCYSAPPEIWLRKGGGELTGFFPQINWIFPAATFKQYLINRA